MDLDVTIILNSISIFMIDCLCHVLLRNICLECFFFLTYTPHIRPGHPDVGEVMRGMHPSDALTSLLQRNETMGSILLVLLRNLHFRLFGFLFQRS